MRNESCDCLDELLTELDPPYESVKELKIGRTLDKYGIPFLYKLPTIIMSEGTYQIWQPSFTLPQYGSLVIDLAADEQSYKTKQETYRYNQIPAYVLQLKTPKRPDGGYDRCPEPQDYVGDLGTMRCRAN